MKKSALCFVLCLLLVVGALFGCGGDPMEDVKPGGDQQGEQGTPESTGPEAAEGLHFTPEEYPRVDGSTATIPLSEYFGAALMGLPLEEARQYILHNTTHNAYVNLINGEKDIIFVTYPSEEEFALAKEAGIELEVVPVVSEGFVFFVNGENPVEELTFDEIRGIYSGEITNWSEVGGDDVDIIPYQRPVNSGSQTGMYELVIGPDEIMAAPEEQVIGAMGEIIDAVAIYDDDRASIGYSYYYFVKDMWGDDNIKLLAVDGIAPDKDTISSAEYPIHTAYYAVLRSDEPEDSNARRLLDWILSSEGQEVAQEAGYVKLGE